MVDYLCTGYLLNDLGYPANCSTTSPMSKGSQARFLGLALSTTSTNYAGKIFCGLGTRPYSVSARSAKPWRMTFLTRLWVSIKSWGHYKCIEVIYMTNFVIAQYVGGCRRTVQTRLQMWLQFVQTGLTKLSSLYLDTPSFALQLPWFLITKDCFYYHVVIERPYKH